MVLSFAPPGTDADPCAGVNAYVAGRPPVPDALLQANLSLFVINTVAHLITLVWMWAWRDKPRFRKVRPFSLSFFLILGFILYDLSCFLSPVYPLPCALVLFCYISALSWFGNVVTLRALALTVETQYMTLAKKEQNLFSAEETASQVTTTLSHVSSRASTVLSFGAVIISLLRVALGYATVDGLSMSELIMTKKSYVVLFAILSLPSLICFVCVVAIVPAYQSCNDCEAFLEVPIAFTVALGFYLAMAARSVFVAYKTVGGFDNKGVLMELFTIPLVVGTLAFVIWILMIVDPGNLSYNREFNWSILFAVTTSIFWTTCFGYQIYVQWRDDRRTTKLEIVDMKTLCKIDASVSKEFMEFASKQYVIESLQFLEDIDRFKQFYFEKADTWRTSKFKSLVETYILNGAKMEINISHSVRSKIIRQYETLIEQGTNPKLHLSNEYYDSFDASYKDVERMVNDGVWTEFLLKRAKHHSTMGGKTSAIVASNH